MDCKGLLEGLLEGLSPKRPQATPTSLFCAWWGPRGTAVDCGDWTAVHCGGPLGTAVDCAGLCCLWWTTVDCGGLRPTTVDGGGLRGTAGHCGGLRRVVVSVVDCGGLRGTTGGRWGLQASQVELRHVLPEGGWRWLATCFGKAALTTPLLNSRLLVVRTHLSCHNEPPCAQPHLGTNG